MRKLIEAAVIGCCLTILSAVGVRAQSAEEDAFWKAVQELPWQEIGSGAIGGQSTISIPAQHVFLASEGSSKLLELLGNLPSPNAHIIAPDQLQWFAVFEFEDSGYVQDNETIDPAALLDVLKTSNQQEQEERRSRNLPVLILDGWAVEPHYDTTTNHLEWGVNLHDDTGMGTVNYTIKLLGRHGVMNAMLVSSPEQFQSDLGEFRTVLDGYSFVPGAKYSEYRQGDKLAAYGLTALIVGGAAAAAAKSGLLKYIAIGAFGLLAALSSFFKRFFKRSQT
jgi:uncharacterized membrane-anchored protein